MYIEPNSQVRLLSGVPLDDTYDHTIYFADATAQYNFFSSKVKSSFNNVSYARAERGVIRLEGTADDYYDCNYIMFQNTSFGSKWFYAFIKKAPEYVSNNVFRIEFEIDDMQTWMFDYTVDECFVVREHSETDVAGDNLQSEPVSLGEITCSASAKSGHMQSYKVLICEAVDDSVDFTAYQAGLFTGCMCTPFEVDNAEDVAELKAHLQRAVKAGMVDQIVNLVMMPSEFVSMTEAPAVQVASVAKPTSINGYTPKNKKLLTYPYNFLNVDCGNADANYHYEWFADNDNDTCNFEMVGTTTSNPQIMLVPQGYNGVDAEGFNYTEKLTMSGFPQCAFSVDSFRAWLATEASGDIATLAGGYVTAELGMEGALAQGLSPYEGMSIGNITSQANQSLNIMQKATRPPQAKGTNSGGIDVASRTKDFYFRRMQITSDYARAIDDFFSRFGYATNRLKTPNTHSRPHWNYVKTSGCTITGSIPTDSAKRICSIYNNGITFWKNGNEIGNYSLDNSPS